MGIKQASKKITWKLTDLPSPEAAAYTAAPSPFSNITGARNDVELQDTIKSTGNRTVRLFAWKSSNFPGLIHEFLHEDSIFWEQNVALEIQQAVEGSLPQLASLYESLACHWLTAAFPVVNIQIVTGKVILNYTSSWEASSLSWNTVLLLSLYSCLNIWNGQIVVVLSQSGVSGNFRT